MYLVSSNDLVTVKYLSNDEKIVEMAQFLQILNNILECGALEVNNDQVKYLCT